MMITLRDRRKTRVQTSSIALYRATSVITRHPDTEHPALELSVGSLTMMIIYTNQEDLSKDLATLDTLTSLGKEE